jgi:hypothetical protein
VTIRNLEGTPDWRSHWRREHERAERLEAELKRIIDNWNRAGGALFECAKIAGADISGGIPTLPPLHEWAVREVTELRADYDEALADIGRDPTQAERTLAEIRAAFDEDYIEVPEHGWVLRPRGLRRVAKILERTK